MEPLLPKAASKEAEQLSWGGGLWHSPLPRLEAWQIAPSSPRNGDSGGGLWYSPSRGWRPGRLPPPAPGMEIRGEGFGTAPPEAGGLADCPLQPPDWRLLKGRANGAPTPQGCI